MVGFFHGGIVLGNQGDDDDDDGDNDDYNYDNDDDDDGDDNDIDDNDGDDLHRKPNICLTFLSLSSHLWKMTPTCWTW